jgi:hypothetical protein
MKFDKLYNLLMETLTHTGATLGQSSGEVADTNRGQTQQQQQSQTQTSTGLQNYQKKVSLTSTTARKAAERDAVDYIVTRKDKKVIKPDEDAKIEAARNEFNKTSTSHRDVDAVKQHFVKHKIGEPTYEITAIDK